MVVALAWSNSFAVPFLLDDHESILGNASIRDFWTLGWLFPPSSGGETVSGRPVLNLSFAIDHALGGDAVAVYHATNLGTHLGAALLFYGIVRRTLRRVRPSGGSAPAANSSDGAAAAATLLWAVHPLQTAAVTYLSQRAESLAAVGMLASLYAFIRSIDGGGSRLWRIASIAAALLAMMAKETAVVTPLVVFLYDRAFVGGTLADAWRLRGRFHLAVASGWVVLAGLVWANRGRGGSAGFGAEVSVLDYVLTQGVAIPRYLWLTVWPRGQVFDYGAVVAGPTPAAVLGLVSLAGLAGVSVWALVRNTALGFLGAVFFVLLAPSSSIVPVATQTIAEHRMYLPLGCVVLGLVVAARRLMAGDRMVVLRVILPVAAISVWGVLTWRRNNVLGSELSAWADTVAERPENPRARNNLGLALARAGRPEEALAQYRAAIALQPNHVFAHDNLGTLLLERGRPDEALSHFETAVALSPDSVGARVNLARALAALGRGAEAAQQYRRVLAADPRAYDAANNLGAWLVTQGELVEGEAVLRRALEQAPQVAEVHYHLARAREKANDLRVAEAEYREAVRLNPDFAPAYRALGAVLQRRGDAVGAMAALRQSLALAPSAEAHHLLGNLAARAQQFAVAMAEYRAALDIDPDHVAARNNLGNCLLALGRFREAAAAYEEVLRRRPDDLAVRRNLAVAREQLGRE